MKVKRLFLGMAFLMAMLCSCVKNAVELNGVALDGKLKLPLVSASYSIGDLLGRFDMDTLVVYDDDGSIHARYSYSIDEALKGSDFMIINDVALSESYSVPNPFEKATQDTAIIGFSVDIPLRSDYIGGIDCAIVRSGQIDFGFYCNTNKGPIEIRYVSITSPNIKDAQGNDMDFRCVPNENNSFDMSGVTMIIGDDGDNMLQLNFAMCIENSWKADGLIDVSANLNVSNLDLKLIEGHVLSFGTRERLDVGFGIFPGNVQGHAAFYNANIKLFARNGFRMAAIMAVDTAIILPDNAESYDVFDPEAVTTAYVGPMTTDFKVAFNQDVQGHLSMGENRFFASSSFTLNPGGSSEKVIVCDTNALDVRAEVDIPVDISVEGLDYYDTISMQVSDISYPELIESVLLGLAVDFKMPFNATLDACMYDSSEGKVTRELVSNMQLECAMDPNQSPVTNTVEILIDKEFVDDLMGSDGLIVHFNVNTAFDGEETEVVLRKDDFVKVSLKADVDYKGNVEFE